MAQDETSDKIYDVARDLEKVGYDVTDTKDGIEKSLEMLSGMIRRTEDLAEQIKALGGEAAAREERIRELEAKLANAVNEAETANRGLEDAGEQIKGLEFDLRHKDAVIADLRQEIADLQMQLDEINKNAMAASAFEHERRQR